MKDGREITYKDEEGRPSFARRCSMMGEGRRKRKERERETESRWE